MSPNHEILRNSAETASESSLLVQQSLSLAEVCLRDLEQTHRLLRRSREAIESSLVLLGKDMSAFMSRMELEDSERALHSVRAQGPDKAISDHQSRRDNSDGAEKNPGSLNDFQGFA